MNINKKEPKDEEFGFATSALYYLFSKSFPSMKSFYSFIADDLSKAKFSYLLDIGCGPGILDLKIAQMFPKSNIYGIDPSKYMIKKAKSLALKNSAKNLNFAIGKNTSIPFGIKFDMIITTLSFHHWAVKRPALEYISGKLSKDGILAIYEFLKPEKRLGIAGSHSLSMGEAKSYSDLNGLKIAEIKTVNGFIKLAFSKD
jgi:ubiquinone/menaquinone biosynthesis C-methylase UbiE